MSGNKNKIVRQYLNQICYELNAPRSFVSAFRKKVGDEIMTEIDGCDNVTLEMLHERFGEPAKVARDVYTRRDYQEMLGKAKKKLFLWRIAAAALAALLVAFAVWYIVSPTPVIYIEGSCLVDGPRDLESAASIDSTIPAE